MASRRPGVTAHGGLALRAGPLSAELVDGNLRWVRAGSTDLVQRIYVAVRDTAFNTIMPRVQIAHQAIADDHFDIEVRARHRDRDIDFSWHGWISGTAEGRVSYRFEGRARAPFSYNKIGLNVVHPTTTHAGRRVEASGGPGGPFQASLPRLVGPQAVRDGAIRGIIPPFRSLSVRLEHGVLDLEFEGDDFEMEDERNWTETGFKSYSGPLSRPWPLTADEGMTIRQAITFRYRGVVRPRREAAPLVALGGPSSGWLPRLGHLVPEEGPSLTTSELRLLRAARPSFLQADLRFDRDATEHLARVATTVHSLERPLLAALYLGDDLEGELGRFLEWTSQERLPLQGLILYTLSTASALGEGTPAEVVRAALPMLRSSLPQVPIAVGSDRFLSEVIRSKPSTHGADAIVFGISPAGHTDEDWAIVDSLPAQGDAVRTLQAHLGDTPVYVAPITLQTRFGSWPRRRLDQPPLPLQVDVRQRGLLAAAWTLASIRELAMTKVTLATYFQTVGWQGLFEREHGCAAPEAFPSRPLEAFPLLQLFSDLGELRDTALIDTSTTGPMTSLAFGTKSAETILLANLAPTRVEVAIGPLPDGPLAVRMLDRYSLATARHDPARFRARARTVEASRGYARVGLGPYAYARLDVPA